MLAGVGGQGRGRAGPGQHGQLAAELGGQRGVPRDQRVPRPLGDGHRSPELAVDLRGQGGGPADQVLHAGPGRDAGQHGRRPLVVAVGPAPVVGAVGGQPAVPVLGHDPERALAAGGQFRRVVLGGQGGLDLVGRDDLAAADPVDQGGRGDVDELDLVGQREQRGLVQVVLAGHAAEVGGGDDGDPGVGQAAARGQPLSPAGVRPVSSSRNATSGRRAAMAAMSGLAPPPITGSSSSSALTPSRPRGSTPATSTSVPRDVRRTASPSMAVVVPQPRA